MATYTNPAHDKQSLPTPYQKGELAFAEFKFDFAASYKPTTKVADDLWRIGVVPAGCRLVPHLSLINIPILDTNGTPTGDYEIGTAADPDALKAAAAAETAVVLSGEDFVFATSVIGSETADTPIYVKLTNTIATLQTTGAITSRLVYRPFDSVTDS